MDESHLNEVIQAVKDQAWFIREECPHCEGSGTIPGNDQMTHSISPTGFGANWDAEDLIDAIKKSESIEWVDDAWGHELQVEVDGRLYRFQIKKPK